MVMVAVPALEPYRPVVIVVMVMVTPNDHVIAPAMAVDVYVIVMAPVCRPVLIVLGRSGCRSEGDRRSHQACKVPSHRFLLWEIIWRQNAVVPLNAF